MASMLPPTNSSTRHVLEALRVIARSEQPLGLTELAEALDLPPSTAHRALMTLEESGFALRVGPSARFSVGINVHHLVRSMVALFPIRQIAQEPMRALSTAMAVTVSLNWRLSWHNMRLLSIEGPHEAFQLRRVGEIRPLHDGIGPATILAALPREEEEEYVAQATRRADLGAISLDREVLAARRREMEERGYLTLPPAADLGLDWLSAPLRRSDGEAVASLSVGFSDRLAAGPHDEAHDREALEHIRRFQELLDAHPKATMSPFASIDLVGR